MSTDGEPVLEIEQLQLDLENVGRDGNPGSAPATGDDAGVDSRGSTERACAVCGASLDGRRRHAIYCSAACRSAARDMERAARRTDPGRRPCPACGGSMAGRRQDAVYCSAACRAGAWSQAHGRPSEGNETDRPRETVQRRTPAAVDRVTLTRPEAAAALGISVDSFERHVQPDLRLIRRGRIRLVPLAELERWAERSASLTLDRPVR